MGGGWRAARELAAGDAGELVGEHRRDRVNEERALDLELRCIRGLFAIEKSRRGRENALSPALLGGALKSYQDGLDIRKRLAALDPANTEWQTDLVVSAWKMSGLVPHGLTREASAVQLQDALVILARLKANGALRADQQGWSQMIQQRLDSWK